MRCFKYFYDLIGAWLIIAKCNISSCYVELSGWSCCPNPYITKIIYNNCI